MTCGEETAAQIDQEVLSMITDAHEQAKKLLMENRDALDQISEYLFEKETITGKEFMKLFRKITGIEAEEQEDIAEAAEQTESEAEIFAE